MKTFKAGSKDLVFFICHLVDFLFQGAPKALGIGAASFWSVAEKDIAERPKKDYRHLSTVNCVFEDTEILKY